jgi:hypothetical protein
LLLLASHETMLIGRSQTHKRIGYCPEPDRGTSTTERRFNHLTYAFFKYNHFKSTKKTKPWQYTKYSDLSGQ